jgi:hypothetical protein
MLIRWAVGGGCGGGGRYFFSLHILRVAEPKLFDSAPAAAPDPTIEKFPLRLPLRLRLELCGCLFSQLLNEKVNFS